MLKCFLNHILLFILLFTSLFNPRKTLTFSSVISDTLNTPLESVYVIAYSAYYKIYEFAALKTINNHSLFIKFNEWFNFKYIL